MSSRQHKTPSKDKAPALPDPQQGHISSPPPELKFFMFSDPAEARSASNKKLVRSHVARTSHAKSRRAQSDNVAASSSSQGGLEHVQYEYEAEAPENSMAGPLSSSSWDSSTSYQGSFTMPEPQFASAGYQSYGSQGPANYAPTQLSSDEQYLLDHCEFSSGSSVLDSLLSPSTCLNHIADYHRCWRIHSKTPQPLRPSQTFHRCRPVSTRHDCPLGQLLSHGQ